MPAGDPAGRADGRSASSSHDARLIGLGEDGPTHQPVEHLAALRAMPNLLVFRPGRRGRDGGMLAARLEGATTPSVMALTRQNLPRCAQPRSEICAARGA